MWIRVRISVFPHLDGILLLHTTRGVIARFWRMFFQLCSRVVFPSHCAFHLTGSDQRPQPCVCVAVNVLEIHNTDKINTCSSCSCAVFVYSPSALNITSVFIRLLFFPVLVLFPLSLFAVSSITYLSLHNMHPNNLFTSRDVVVIQAAALRLLCSTVRRPPLNKDHWLQYHIDTDD